jgi:hypothetical protein
MALYMGMYHHFREVHGPGMSWETWRTPPEALPQRRPALTALPLVPVA